MSLKAKLVSTIAAFCMVICLLSVGIWAANTGTVNVGGSVNFVAEDVNVKIELLDVVGAGKAGDDYAKEAIEWDATDVGTLSADWTDMVFAFQKADDGSLGDIVITIKVTNLSEERAVSVAPTAAMSEGADEDVDVTFTGATSIAAKGNEVYTITISTTKTGNDTVATSAWTGSLVITNTPA
jgi:hypothetical protein